MKTIKEKIKDFALRALKRIALAIVRTLFVLAGYSVFLAIRTLECLLFILSAAGKFFGVEIKGFESDAPFDNTQKFTEDELKDLAGRLPRGDMTLEEIADHYSVSYRQARKIKDSWTTPLSVKRFA